ncbi:S-layer family protein, partial [Salmonella enterica subsp. enterica serovar Newport]|nr:S-layer family protein [Salmonella enterica subsp. enterica serovar Newport]MJR82449.1 S-layer family protein [Salmonella enterica subsp. enterica serovar Newport]
ATSNSSVDANNTWTPMDTGSQIQNTLINSELNGGTNVTILTSGNDVAGQWGNITLSADISKTSGGNASLTLNADGNINITNHNITSTAGALNVNLCGAGAVNSTVEGGTLILNHANITTNGGNLTAGTRNLNKAFTVNISNGTVINASTGNITLAGYNDGINLSAANMFALVRNGNVLVQVVNSTLSGGDILICGTSLNNSCASLGFRLTNTAVSALGNLTLLSTGDATATMAGGNITGTTGANMNLTAGGNLTISSSGGISALGTLLLNNINLNGANVSITGCSTNATLNIAGMNLTAVNITTPGNVLIAGTGTTGSNSVLLANSSVNATGATSTVCISGYTACAALAGVNISNSTLKGYDALISGTTATTTQAVLVTGNSSLTLTDNLTLCGTSNAAGTGVAWTSSTGSANNISITGISTSSGVGASVNSGCLTALNTLVACGTSASGIGLNVTGNLSAQALSLTGTSTSGIGVNLNAGISKLAAPVLCVTGTSNSSTGLNIGAVVLNGTGESLTLTGTSTSGTALSINGSTITNATVTAQTTNFGIATLNGTISNSTVNATSLNVACGTYYAVAMDGGGANISNTTINVNAAGTAGGVTRLGTGNFTDVTVNAISTVGTGAIQLCGAISGAGNLTLNGTDSAAGYGVAALANTSVNITGNLNITGKSSTGTGVNISAASTTLSASQLNLSGTSTTGGNGYILNATRGGGIANAANIYLGSAGSSKNTINILGDNLALSVAEVQLLMSRGADSLTQVSAPGLLITNNGSGDLTQDYSGGRGGGWYLNGANISVTGGGNASLTGVSFANGTIAVDGSLNITNANSPVLLTNENITTGGAVNVNAAGRIEVTTTCITSNGGVSLVSHSGNSNGVNVTAKSAITSGGDVVIDGGAAEVNISSSNISANNISISGTGRDSSGDMYNNPITAHNNQAVAILSSNLSARNSMAIAGTTNFKYLYYSNEVIRISDSQFSAGIFSMTGNAISTNGSSAGGAGIKFFGNNIFDLTDSGTINATTNGGLYAKFETDPAIYIFGNISLVQGNMTINADGGQYTGGVRIQSSSVLNVANGAALRINASNNVTSSNASQGAGYNAIYSSAISVADNNANALPLIVTGGGYFSLCATNNAGGYGALLGGVNVSCGSSVSIDAYSANGAGLAIASATVDDTSSVSLVGSSTNGTGVQVGSLPISTTTTSNISSSGNGSVLISGESTNGAGVIVAGITNITNATIEGTSTNGSGVSVNTSGTLNGSAVTGDSVTGSGV